MPVLSENKCVSTQFELSIRCIEAERERFPKEYICTIMLNATASLCFLLCSFDRFFRQKCEKLTFQSKFQFFRLNSGESGF